MQGAIRHGGRWLSAGTPDHGVSAAGSGCRSRTTGAALALLVLLLALATPSAAAQARHHKGPTDLVGLAYKRAVAYWHGVPCQGKVALRMGHVDSAWEARFEARGQTLFSWASYDRYPSDEANPLLFTNCSVTLNNHFWTRAGMRENWPQLCVAVTHELGNLFGLPEVQEPPGGTSNVMNYVISEVKPPDQCRSRG
jgi:hypothetical protein